LNYCKDRSERPRARLFRFRALAKGPARCFRRGWRFANANASRGLGSSFRVTLTSSPRVPTFTRDLTGHKQTPCLRRGAPMDATSPPARVVTYVPLLSLPSPRIGHVHALCIRSSRVFGNPTTSRGRSHGRVTGSRLDIDRYKRRDVCGVPRVNAPHQRTCRGTVGRSSNPRFPGPRRGWRLEGFEGGVRRRGCLRTPAARGPPTCDARRQRVMAVLVPRRQLLS
jgi:hypothetical protein